METASYSARQRRAINLVWTACGDYSFEPRFLALRSNGEPDFYMNCVIGLVHKWLGDEMPNRLFARWAGDTRPIIALVPEHDSFLTPEQAIAGFAPIPQIDIRAFADCKHLWVGETQARKVINAVAEIVVPRGAALPTTWP